MASLPACILEEVSPADTAAVVSWWAGVSESSRAELVMLLDPRADSCSYALTDDEQGLPAWQPIPIEVNNKLLADPFEPDADWAADYFEYRLLNPERWPIPLYEARTFHIGGQAEWPGSIAAPEVSCPFSVSANAPANQPLHPTAAALPLSEGFCLTGGRRG
jgi:hypothetical protein